jgi:hypothetical protein
MTNRLSKLGVFTALALLLSTPASAADGVKVNELVIAAPIPDAQRYVTIHAARAFYDIWNTGGDALLKQAIAPDFHAARWRTPNALTTAGRIETYRRHAQQGLVPS